jgi:hypothetical protein
VPVYKKAFTGQDIVNGLATVHTGNNTAIAATYAPGSGRSDYTQSLPSGEGLNVFDVLESRFKGVPSGWNEPF